MKAFDDTLNEAKKSYFDSEYKSKQLHLRILATHPDFQRRGAGSALCRWGMEYAGNREEPLTLFSSPMGQKLYLYLGFKYRGKTVTVQVEGETEKLSIRAMNYRIKSSQDMDGDSEATDSEGRKSAGNREDVE
ncbi:GNAT family N-acetyltransferase [Candidatus Bathyarchaeota archaeon]|nr:GNAT family N-acetyltransferase [Candidatus Bathyarchaeota archaeon]